MCNRYRRTALRRVPQVLSVLALLAISVINPVPASAALPAFDGAMSFPAIHGPSDPEEFSWEVNLGEEQALALIDDQHAEIFYTDDHHTVVTITPTLAHDADGTTVPTSLSVTQPNVITLIVHHRAGNPAAEGASFVYPVSAGAGWEGGFQTEIVTGPKDEQELNEEQEAVEAVEEVEEVEEVDGAPPNTKIFRRLLKRHPPIFVFTFRSSTPQSTFRCRLDRHPIALCPSSLRLRHLAPGRHVLRASAVDVSGHEDPTPAVAHFRVRYGGKKPRHRKHGRHHRRRHDRGGRR